MYNQEFAFIYDTYGWDTFSITMGNAILEFLESKNVKIKKHLDLACGVGTLCHLFSKEGIPTKGIDISGDMIEKARENDSEIPFEVHDMINYQTEEKYELITCTCDAINHILEKQDIETLFKNIDTYLEKGGYLIFDAIDESNLPLNKKWISQRSKDVYVEYDLKKEGEFLKNHLEVYENNKCIAKETIKERIYNREFLLEIASKIEWQLIQCEKQIANEFYNTNAKLFYIFLKKC